MALGRGPFWPSDLRFSKKTPTMNHTLSTGLSVCLSSDFSVQSLFYHLFLMIKMNEKLERKVRIENVNRCLNCISFVTCSESFKENIADCGEKFVELPLDKQVLVVSLIEEQKDVK
ncbi:MAG: hypothetical protein GX638_06640 [Crenarchaeota archaeon]|nr:hypothetical protein [Thermoproteota archaeon]